MRKWLWQAHSWMGLMSGVFLLIIGVSGSAVVFHAELNALAHPNLFIAEGGPNRLAYDVLHERFLQQLPDYEIVGWPVENIPDTADSVRVRRLGEAEVYHAYLNPYTGAVHGIKDWKETLAGWLLALHYSLFLDTAGVVFCGVLATLLCLLGLSGLVIYRRFWRFFLTMRWRASARILFSDLHKFVGVSSVVFNLILGFTGAWWNLQSIPDLFSAEIDSKPEPVRLYSGSPSLDEMLGKACAALPGLDLTRTYITFPRQAGEPFIVSGTLPSVNPFRSHYGNQVELDAQNGLVLNTVDIRQQSVWSQVEDMMGPLHYGSFGGLPVKVLWCLGGLTPGFLAITGFVIRHRRKRGAGSKR